MSKMNNAVFVIRDGKVVEKTYNDLSEYIVTTTRPGGVGPKYYVTTDSKGVWCMAKWSTWNGPEMILVRYDSEEEAQAAVEEIWIGDIDVNPDESVFQTREAAEEFLSQEL